MRQSSYLLRLLQLTARSILMPSIVTLLIATQFIATQFIATLFFATLFIAQPATAQPATDPPDPSSPQAAEPDSPSETPPSETPPTGEATPGVAQFKIELSPAEITVGDRVEAQLTLVWMGPEPTSEPRFPTWQETWGSAEILSTSELESFTDQSARRIYRQKLTLTAFETGDVKLPRVTIAVPLASETLEVTHDDEASFVVQSVLPQTEAEAGDDGNAGEGGGELQPRPAAPLMALSADQRFLWTLCVLVGLTLLMAWLLRRRLGTHATGVATQPLAPPLEELLQRLRQLDPSAPEPAHTGLSYVLRNFLGRKLSLQAVESTTTEIQRLLRQTSVPPAIAQGTVRLLQDCDHVKFARREVAETTTDDRLLRARELAREIETALQPPELSSDQPPVEVAS